MKPSTLQILHTEPDSPLLLLGGLLLMWRRPVRCCRRPVRPLCVRNMSQYSPSHSFLCHPAQWCSGNRADSHKPTAGRLKEPQIGPGLNWLNNAKNMSLSNRQAPPHHPTPDLEHAQAAVKPVSIHPAAHKLSTLVATTTPHTFTTCAHTKLRQKKVTKSTNNQHNTPCCERLSKHVVWMRTRTRNSSNTRSKLTAEKTWLGRDIGRTNKPTPFLGLGLTV